MIRGRAYTGLICGAALAILYKLKFNQTVTTIPTAGFNVECLVHRNVKFHVWVGGRPMATRPHGSSGSNPGE